MAARRYLYGDDPRRLDTLKLVKELLDRLATAGDLDAIFSLRVGQTCRRRGLPDVKRVQ